MSFRRIHDISKWRTQKPLVIERPPRVFANSLKIERKQTGKKPEFDLRLEKRKNLEADEIFVSDSPRRSFAFGRVQLLSGALAFVIFINLFSVFGAGKATVERVIANSFSGLQSLVQAGESLTGGDFATSVTEFQKSSEYFRQAEEDVTVLSGSGAVLSTQPENVQTGARLVTAGRSIAEAGQHFAVAASALIIAVQTWPEQQRYVAAGGSQASFSTELAGIFRKIAEGASELESAQAMLGLVDPTTLPDDLAGKIKASQAKLDFFLNFAQPYLAIVPRLPELLGERIPRKYLVLFQNSDEIRPTGGFIGSFAELTLNDGFVTEFRLRDIYELDGQLVAKNIPPPEGFGFLTDNWGLRDANYHPDFPTSAAAAAWLYEEGGGGTVDGVFAVTSSLLTRLVELAGGEIQLARFPQPIMAEDLNLLLSLVIEAKTDGVERPKQILNEVWEVLRKKLITVPVAQLLEITQSVFRAKEVQFWSAEPDFQEVAEVFQIDGALIETSQDYLLVSDTSLSGNKSDRYTSNQLKHVTELQPDGAVVDRLTLTRTHGWDDTAEKRMRRLASDFGIALDSKLMDLLGRGRNVDLIKIFVPLGSELISVAGVSSDRIETHSDGKYTYFLLPLTVQPGDSREVRLTYRLPEMPTESYKLTVEHQAGVKPIKFEKIILRAGEEILAEEVLLDEVQEFELPE